MWYGIKVPDLNIFIVSLFKYVYLNFYHKINILYIAFIMYFRIPESLNIL